MSEKSPGGAPVGQRFGLPYSLRFDAVPRSIHRIDRGSFAYGETNFAKGKVALRTTSLNEGGFGEVKHLQATRELLGAGRTEGV